MMIKKYGTFISIIILAFVVVTLFKPKKLLYKEGCYEGVGQGNHSQIKVKVITGKYRIKEIKILEQEETPGLCDIVYDEIPESVLKNNNVDVNVVSGASYTSQGLINAIKDAVNKAKLKKGY
ncbi:FMN-binding protein [Clostridium oceanicum]|uniref:FMN-binding domain-containing protein n=1 Tax=Clostridium oceanicum TaxID=1543 RepID=A0ABP3UMU5_9CLOT